MTPEEFIAGVVAIHKYLTEKERPIELKESPRIWKISGRMIP